MRLSSLPKLFGCGLVILSHRFPPIRCIFADLVIPSPNKRQERESLINAACIDLLDEALVVYMKPPRSFTAEDVVEIQSHGGAWCSGMVCKVCIESGARMAEPGEFTSGFSQRTLDLSQAERYSTQSGPHHPLD